jgi:hypothetical protein
VSLEDDAAKFGRHFDGGWLLGLLVARNVHKKAGPGRLKKSEQVPKKVSCAEFAEKAGISVRTVQWFYNTWAIAADAGYCTSADELRAGDEDPRLSKVDVDSHEFCELWRKFYREARPGAGGGARGVGPIDKLNRAVKAIEGIDVAAAKDQAQLQQQLESARTRVCELIDELLASIQPIESN